MNKQHKTGIYSLSCFISFFLFHGIGAAFFSPALPVDSPSRRETVPALPGLLARPRREAGAKPAYKVREAKRGPKQKQTRAKMGPEIFLNGEEGQTNE